MSIRRNSFNQLVFGISHDPVCALDRIRISGYKVVDSRIVIGRDRAVDEKVSPASLHGDGVVVHGIEFEIVEWTIIPGLALVGADLFPRIVGAVNVEQMPLVRVS